MTIGQIMVYGGAALIGLGVLGIILCVPLFTAQRKKYAADIRREYE